MTTEEKRKEYLKGCEIFGVDEKGLGGFDHEADECHTCEMKTPDMHGACKVESEAGKKPVDGPVEEKEEVDAVTEEEKPVEKVEVEKDKPEKKAHRRRKRR